VVSAFVDNAGIVNFDDRHDLAVKVETHNHPSAVEPFGGANTGVGGVIRDVLGVAADPIAVTDVLCFGPTDLAPAALPDGVLHPRRIAEGVIDGIADYGNKLGLPTVAGAIVRQAGFTANPLVFCGCIGLRPTGLSMRGPSAGERIVVLGGATGRDGIRGATFSSATMDATTGDVAGASVQIGDPIVEKLVADVLRDARDASLFTAITDCGAGGFSSAIGEIAASLGADVDLDLAPRKYPGLAPWEVWLSEAQERMVIAVRPGDVGTLRRLCEAHGVSMADLGAFRSDGRLLVRCNGSVIVDLPGAFLHDGRPQRSLTAQRPVPPPPDGDRTLPGGDLTHLLRAVLSHPDVRSNEDVVRRYDHEILGATIGRPYLGAEDDGPGDAAVLAPLSSPGGTGLAIGIGVNCRTGAIDARRMAEAVVDEAIRNVVATGADPDRVALLDNFSWGDPRRPETLGRLVDAVAGCCGAAAAHRSPFVSGKDSLNNEYLTSDGQRHAIPPTLVITAVGVLPVAERLVTSDVKRADDLVVLLGPASQRDGLRGSVLDAVLGVDAHGDVAGGDPGAPARYRALHTVMRDGLVLAAHDVSDGGLAVALAEMAMGGRLGIEASVPGDDLAAELFAESSGRIVVEVDPAVADEVCRRTGGRVIGRVTSGDRLVVRTDGATPIDVSISELLDAWKGHHG
jgi:phosphoribosylformylglycinamidine synthase